MKSPCETPPRYVFEEVAKYLPQDRTESFYRVLSRLKHLNPDDDLVVVIEAMGMMNKS